MKNQISVLLSLAFRSPRASHLSNKHSCATLNAHVGWFSQKVHQRLARPIEPVHASETYGMRDLTVLVTGATAPGFVSIVKALRKSRKYRMRIIGTDFRLRPSSFHFADEAILLPDNRSSEFANALIEVCEKKHVDVILPIRTDDQLPICENLRQFREVDTEPAIVVTNPRLMRTLLDKKKLLEYSSRVLDLEIPRFASASTRTDLEKAVERLGYPDRPVVVKPSLSQGSRGFRILDATKDRRTLFFEEKPTGIYTTLDDLVSIVGERFPELLVMEYLPGKEYTLDVLCRKGRTFAVVPRLRVRMTGGITTGGIVAKDENYETLHSTASALVEGFGASYNLGMQLRESDSGTPLLLEINPRLQGTTIISVAAGVNIPELMVQMALREYDYDTRFDVRWGLEMDRVWFEVFQFEERTWATDDL